jgi:hypothetical protein
MMIFLVEAENAFSESFCHPTVFRGAIPRLKVDLKIVFVAKKMIKRRNEISWRPTPKKSLLHILQNFCGNFAKF